MYLGSFLYRIADPKKQEAEAPFWHSVRAIANPLEDDWQRNSLRATSIALASIGMVVFAILVGMVTETVQTAVENADGEGTRVVVSDHVLVCGWGKHVSQIVKDVNNVSNNTKIVVLAAPEKRQAMINDIRSSIPESNRRNSRIFFRSGAPINAEDLERVAASSARKIILVNPKEGDPVDADRLILSRALAIRQNLPSFKGDIVAELNHARDEVILRSIMASSPVRSVETINSERLLFRFMAQAIRQPGLADVVALLMGEDPSCVFHVQEAKDAAPQLVGTNFNDLRPTSIPGCMLCGFFDDNGAMLMETGSQFSASGGGQTLRPDSKLLLLGLSKSTPSGKFSPKKAQTYEMSTSTSAIMDFLSQQRAENSAAQCENFLVLGWRQEMESMLQELDSMLKSGSNITIVDADAPEHISLDLKNVKVTCLSQRADRYETLEGLLKPGAKAFDHVVVLGSSLGEQSASGSTMAREEDSKALSTLVYVNDLLQKQRVANSGKRGGGKRTMVTVEFVNERVADIAKEQGNVANAVLPQNLSAKIAAQTVRDYRLNCVWKELLSQYGREVYLRPVSEYMQVAGEQLSFANLADLVAKNNDDIVIGYIPHYIPKVKINPRDGDRFHLRSWDPKDTLIVLSKD